MKRLLNVGGNSRLIPLPGQYAGYEHLLLDIDPASAADIVCDARQLSRLEAAQFDAVYCAHNLEHYHRHEVPVVLSGFLHVLRDGGSAEIRVPDLAAVMAAVVGGNLDVEDVLYHSVSGPITVLDVIYGFGIEIERSGKDYFAHKTGFTQASLMRVLQRAGFSTIYSDRGQLEVVALAFKGPPPPDGSRSSLWSELQRHR